jgi:hypothetical protein
LQVLGGLAGSFFPADGASLETGMPAALLERFRLRRVTFL